jgi:phosphotriesterase-related protein
MSEPRIITVTGALPASQMGPTLAHEHLYSDFAVFSGRADNHFTASSEVIEELAAFRQAGGRTIVELTPEGTGRDPVQLREISRASGVQVISGIAFYEESTYPAWVRQASVEQIADYFVFHLEEGQNGVRAGVIGEITSHNEPEPNPSGYRLREVERRVFEAAARAQRQTGACITTHAALGRAGHAQLNVLENAGADLRRVIIGHCDAHWHADPQQDYSYYLAILDRGACCEFDLIGWTELAPDEIRADRLAALIQMGYASQLLLATDTCRLSHLRCRGGRGYDFLWKSFLPQLRARGVSDEQIDSMLVKTPQRMFAPP